MPKHNIYAYSTDVDDAWRCVERVELRIRADSEEAAWRAADREMNRMKIDPQFRVNPTVKLRVTK